MDSRLTLAERILFDPACYIHPSRLRLPSGLDTSLQRAALNDMLIATYRLPVEGPAPVRTSEQQLLAAWFRLPVVCKLVGAQLLKSDMVWRGKFMALPGLVRDFMFLPLRSGNNRRSQVLQGTCATVQERAQAMGLQHILAWQESAAPAWLQRLPLLFSSGVESLAVQGRTAEPLKPDIFLIFQAIQYAKNHPDIL